MPTSVTFNGSSYSIPLLNESGWGSSLSALLTDLSSNTVTASASGTLTNKLIRAQPGILGAPAYSFVANSSSGLYQPSTGNMALVINGVAQQTFSASGCAFPVAVTAPTMAAGDASTNVATTQFVTTAATAASAVSAIGYNASGTDANGLNFRARAATFSAGIRIDNVNCYLLDSATPTGGITTHRPFLWNLSTGAVTIDAGSHGTNIVGPTILSSTLNVSGTTALSTLTAGASTLNSLSVSTTAVISSTLSVFGNSAFTTLSTSGQASVNSLSCAGNGQFATVGTSGNITCGSGATLGSLGNLLISGNGQILGGFTANTILANGGYMGKAGTGGGTGGNFWNYYWTGSQLNVYVDATLLGAMSYTSDARIKADITAAPAGALARVMQYRVVEYDFADVGIFRPSGKRRLGFIAQEIEQVTPSAVTGAADGVDPTTGAIVPQTLDDRVLIAELTAALQELRAEVAALTA